jgi:hypothetical protein
MVKVLGARVSAFQETEVALETKMQRHNALFTLLSLMILKNMVFPQGNIFNKSCLRKRVGKSSELFNKCTQKMK